MVVTFDRALPELVSVVAGVVEVGPLAAGEVVFVRDVSGLLTVAITKEEVVAKRHLIADRLGNLGPYVDKILVATPEELFDLELRGEDIGFSEAVLISGSEVVVRLVDRWLVGADWQRRPLDPVSNVPVVVFWSLKGGVGI